MTRTVAIIGAGPAGLMAAERLSGEGLEVTVYDRMPSPGRKFLMAGRGGLNLTHSEDLGPFMGRYGEAAPRLRALVEAFPPAALIAWAEGLGQPTFVGSSGRVFPKALKASPLLRAWLTRLGERGVTLRSRWDWRGWDADGRLAFATPGGPVSIGADAVVLALGGASWPKLGSDGRWTNWVAARGVEVAPWRPANVGFKVGWSEVFRDRFAGAPLKNIQLGFAHHRARGDAVVTDYGIEGGAVYALSAVLRDALAKGEATVHVDLRPDMSRPQLIARLDRPRGRLTVTNHLRKALKLSPVEIGLLREGRGAALPETPSVLADAIKDTPVRLSGVQSIDRAISSAGGVALAELDDGLMLSKAPGVFAAGEMLDWEAPTGGYLLQASFATGLAAASGVKAWLARR